MKSEPTVSFGISAESMERAHEACKAVRPLNIGGAILPVVIDPSLSLGVVRVASFAPFVQAYYQERAQSEQLLLDAQRATGKPAHELRTMAACQAIGFDDYMRELIRRAFR